MKITANEIKPGMIIEHKNDLWNVLKTSMSNLEKVGRLIKLELKSVIKGTKLNERFRSNENVEKAEVDEKNLIFYILTTKVLFLWTMFHLSKYLSNDLILEIKLNYLENVRDNNIIIR